jgi:uncharacterized damage-inducible protein DinB
MLLAADPETCTPVAVAPLVGVLRQLADLIARLTDDQYTQKPVGVVPSSVGGHIRHNLDHVGALLRGLPGGHVNYDDRDRGTAVEHDRRAALAEIDRLCDELIEYPWVTDSETLRLTALVAPDRPPAEVETSPERELAFVLSHTIHHNALIGVMARLHGVELPADFGYAPSTIAHRRSRPCAR